MRDVPVIRQMCDQVAVMRDGRIVEVAPTEGLFDTPQHDYSRHLLALMPRFEIVKRGPDAAQA